MDVVQEKEGREGGCAQVPIRLARAPSNNHHPHHHHGLFVCSRSSPSVFNMKNSELLDREISLAQSQMSELQARLRGLRSRRNALAPLCRLPPEILVCVMELLAAHRTEDPFANSQIRELALPYLVVTSTPESGT
jgi:hypothetical protein